MHEPEDPIESLRHAEPGTVVYGFSGGDEPHMEFLIRESSPIIAATGEEVQIRAGILEAAGIPVPVVLFRFAPSETVYRAFWNYHHAGAAPEHGNIFDHMAEGPEEILVKLIGDSGRVEKLLVMKHPLSGFFRKAVTQCSRQPVWDMDAFFDALDEIDVEHGNSRELWQLFGRL